MPLDEQAIIERLLFALKISLTDIEVCELRLKWSLDQGLLPGETDQETVTIVLSGKPLDIDQIVNRIARSSRLARRLRRFGIWQGELARKGNTYIELADSDDVKDLRDAVEHFEDYIVGEGNHQSRIVVDDRVVGPTIVYSNSGEDHLVVLFGRYYNLGDVIRAAAAFEPLVDPIGYRTSNRERDVEVTNQEEE